VPGNQVRVPLNSQKAALAAGHAPKTVCLLGDVMDSYEKWGYSLLVIIAIAYLIAIFIGMIAAFPFGLLGLVFIAALGILMIKVLKERLQNKEDDYYSKEVDK
jgi:hypothetical protein